MSAYKRILSGSIASWVRIFVNLFAQVALVPMYLTYWDITTFGLWVALQAIISLVSLINKGQQDYLGFEFLKLNEFQLSELELRLSSGILMGVILSLLQIVVVLLLYNTNTLGLILNLQDNSGGLLKDGFIALLILALNFLINFSISGLFVRVLQYFGYYARMAWWGVLNDIVAALAPIIALILGFGLSGTALILTVSICALNIFLYVDQIRLLKKHSFSLKSFSFVVGLSDFYKSLVITLKSVLDNIRQQGIRILLPQLIGVSGLAVFSTLRTGANVILQGLNTITNPMMPELMTYLREKSQIKIDSLFASIWLVLVCFLSPFVVLLQIFMGSIFLTWTRDKLPYNPTLFGLLSVDVLIYAQIQPALAVITGNNILSTQLIVSIIGAAIAISSMYVLVPFTGIGGTGIALILAQIFNSFVYHSKAKKWFNDNSLLWPKKLSNISFLSTLFASIAILLLSLVPLYRFYIYSAYLIIFIYTIKCFFESFPEFAKTKISQSIKSIYGKN